MKRLIPPYESPDGILQFTPTPQPLADGMPEDMPDDYAMPRWMEIAGRAVAIAACTLGSLMIAHQAVRHMPFWATRFLAVIFVWLLNGGAVAVCVALSETQAAKRRVELVSIERDRQERA